MHLLNDHDYVELPAGASVGDRVAATSTRFFLEVANNGTTDWYRTGTGCNMGDGHSTRAAAQAEWDGFDELLRTQYYTGHRIVQVDTTIAMTVLQLEM